MFSVYKMRDLTFVLLLLCCLLYFAFCAAQNSTEREPRAVEPKQPRLIGGIAALLTKLAVRKMMLKLVRAFTQYFVDIFLGEIIGARGLSDETWTFQWPSWLLTEVDNE